MSDAPVAGSSAPYTTRATPWFSVGPLVAGALLAAVFLQSGFGGRQTHFEDFALGAGTTSYFAEYDGRRIHCTGVRDAAECLSGEAARSARSAVLWLGNSQLHAINQLKPGQVSAAALLFPRLREQGLDLLTFSQPNANLQEHYVLFEYLKRRMPLRQLMVGVVFDDTRETGLRPDVTLALADPATKAALAETGIGRTILANYSTAADETDPDLAGVHHTVQEYAERELNGWLDGHFPLWELRPEARGSLFTGLYRLRNSVLGITAQTKRRTIPGRYSANIEALRAILASAAADGIRVLVYVVPLRDDVAIPYEPADYAGFKNEVARICAEGGAEFADLEHVVPAPLWGQKESTTQSGGLELDFMHFQAEGHARLAAALASILTAPESAGDRS